MSSSTSNREKLIQVLGTLLESVREEKLESCEVDHLLSLLTDDTKLDREVMESLFLGNFILNGMTPTRPFPKLPFHGILFVSIVMFMYTPPSVPESSPLVGEM